MATWVIIVLYVIGYLAFWRIIAYYIAVDISGDAVPEGEWLVSGMILAIFYAIPWPLIVVGMGVRRVYLWRKDTLAVLVVPRSVLKRVELEKRERRIEAMEREVGIKPIALARDIKKG